MESSSSQAQTPPTPVNATTVGAAPGTSLGATSTSASSSAAAKKKAKKKGKASGASGAVDDEKDGAPESDAKEPAASAPAATATTTPAAAKKASTPAPAAAAPPKAGGKKSALAAKILAEKAERERREREEQERIRREEEEEERRLEELRKAEELKKQQAELKKTQRKEQDKERKEKEAAAKRAAAMARYASGGVVIAGLKPKEPSATPVETSASTNTTTTTATTTASADETSVGGATATPPPSGGAAKKRPVYATKKKGGQANAKKDNGSAQSSETASTASSTSSLGAGTTTTDDGSAASSWEEIEEVSTSSVPVPAPVPAPASTSTVTVTATATATATAGSQQPQQPVAAEQAVTPGHPAAPAAEQQQPAQQQAEEGQAGGDEADLRSPICCVLGHVDTGKTKLLDKMRNTSVQEGEVGGITQQIGATYFPMETIKEITHLLNQRYRLTYRVPGLLIMDTPGHASFSNLRTRGSSLCDIAVLVVDIMHGLEPQTIESINLLKMRQTPFVVALNKVDRLYQWRAFKNSAIQDSLKKQQQHVLLEYEERVAQVVTQFAEQGLNATLYYKAKKLKDFAKNVSLVPTSAHTGEGIPDLLLLLVQLTQKLMVDRLESKNDSLQATVLEVKVIEGLGTTIDVILANGTLHEGDEIVLCGMQGPIRTRIRSLLTPPPLRELRVKNQYVHHKELKAAQGVKIAAHNLEDAIAGSQLFVVQPGDDVEQLEKRVMSVLTSLRDKVAKAKTGVYVQASTLGSLEALLDFLGKDCKIPVAGIGIGPVHKRDVMIASVMQDRAPEYACILAFDVSVSNDAREYADKMKVKIFEADIIYHLEDMFKKYLDEMREARRAKAKDEAVFPAVLQILPEHIFRQRNPIVLGVRVKEGILRIGTPIAVLKPDGPLGIGKIQSIEREHKQVDEATVGDEVAVSIAQEEGQQLFMYGRQFDHNDDLVSYITRSSLDALKTHFAEVCMQPAIFKLLKKLKTAFNV
jgi:translation initiation factor 5B